MKNFPLYFSLCVVAVFVIGCDSSAKLYEVRGTVTIDGNPMPWICLSFTPDDPKVKGVAYGFTDASGAYSLSFPGVRTGAPAGEHTVTFNAAVPENPAEAAKTKAAMALVKEESLPATVKRKANVIDFNLTTK